MSIEPPLSPYSFAVNLQGQWTPDWYTWLFKLTETIVNNYVVGPASSFDGFLAAFDGTSGLLLKDSGIPMSWFNQSLLTTASPGFASVAVFDSAGDHRLTFDTGENLTANRSITISPGDTSRIITLSGNPTLADWFDQSVKTTASPAFASVRIMDSAADHTMLIDTGENFTANRSLTFTLGDTSRIITLSGNPTLADWFNQSVKTTDAPVFASIAVYDATATDRLTIDTDEELTAGRSLTIRPNNLDRIITFSGNPTLADWFDQSVKTTANPQFATIEVGAASDTTLARFGAGDISVEGNRVFRAGGTDVPIADGGTGASDAATAFSNLKQAASDTATGVLEIADQTEMEAAADNTRAVVPGRTRFHPGVAKAWVRANVDGTIASSYGVSSVTDGGAGLVTVTFTTAFSSATGYMIAATAINTQTYIHTGNPATTACSLASRAPATGTLTDPATWSAVFFGDN